MDRLAVHEILKSRLSKREFDIWRIDSCGLKNEEYKIALRTKLPLVFWKKKWLTDEELAEQKTIKSGMVKCNRNKALRDRVVIDSTSDHRKKGETNKGMTCRYCSSPMTMDYLDMKIEYYCRSCFAIHANWISVEPAQAGLQTRRVVASVQPETTFSRTKTFKVHLQKIQGRLDLKISRNELKAVREQLDGRIPEYDILKGILHKLGFRHVYGSIHSLQKHLGYPLPDYSEQEMESIVLKFKEMGFDTNEDTDLLLADILALVLEKL